MRLLTAFHNQNLLGWTLDGAGLACPLKQLMQGNAHQVARVGQTLMQQIADGRLTAAALFGNSGFAQTVYLQDQND